MALLFFCPRISEKGPSSGHAQPTRELGNSPIESHLFL